MLLGLNTSTFGAFVVGNLTKRSKVTLSVIGSISNTQEVIAAGLDRANRS